MLHPTLRGIAGFMVLLSVVLTQFVHPNFFWLTVFVGANLLQSAFTNWCPMITILKKIGLQESCPLKSEPVNK